jgi:hypothetical protein
MAREDTARPPVVFVVGHRQVPKTHSKSR